MKRIIVCLGIFFVLINVISGCAPGIKYAHYTSKDSALNLKIDYIAGWIYSEQRGERDAYAQVLFYERELKDKLRRALIAVTARPASGFDSQPVTALSVLYDILNKRSKFQDAAIISKGERSNLLGVEARTAEITYRTLDKLHKAGAKLIPVKERIVVLRKGDIVYTIRYENAARDFASFEKAFNRILKTITVP
jgi:hypothetical protein